MVWGNAGLTHSSAIVAPSVGKVRGRQHYCHIVARNQDGSFNVFDPNGGQNVNKPSGYFEYCWKQ
jgi:hypothetical protein